MPSSRPHWQRDRDTLEARVTVGTPPREIKRVFGLREQWTSLMNNAGPLGAFCVLFQGGNVNVEYLLDSVLWNSAGSLGAMQNVPEPATFSFLLIGSLILLRIVGRADRTHHPILHKSMFLRKYRAIQPQSSAHANFLS